MHSDYLDALSVGQQFPASNSMSNPGFVSRGPQLTSIALTKLMRLMFAPEPRLPPVAFRYLVSTCNPIRPKIRHMYSTRDRNTLWWRVSVHSLQDHKRVIRSWCARRVRLAFKLAMKERGYDSEGRRLASSTTTDMNKADAGRHGNNLRGTVEIVLRPAIVDGQWPMVRRDVDRLVDRIVEVQTDAQNSDSKPTKY